jgi:hypothetical protein
MMPDYTNPPIRPALWLTAGHGRRSHWFPANSTRSACRRRYRGDMLPVDIETGSACGLCIEATNGVDEEALAASEQSVPVEPEAVAS